MVAAQRAEEESHVEHPSVPRVVGVRTAVVARAARVAQRRAETAEEVLCLEDGDALSALGEGESGGKAAHAAAENDGMTHGMCLG